MTKVQAERPLDGMVMGADEIAVGRGQNYWTMISVPEGAPRSRTAERCGRASGRRVCGSSGSGLEKTAPGASHVVMDMWAPFRNSFKAHCPDIQIIYDKFHVIRHLLNAVNDVRKSEFKSAPESGFEASWPARSSSCFRASLTCGGNPARP
ncbi:MAG: transposase [Elusimicrobia bacterium]|nr:transposase [Elusimicrobiota bacterium]